MKNRKLFVGNLNFTVTEEELTGLLSQYGTIMKMTLYKKKGYALVEMEEVSEAQNAIKKLNGKKFKDREIRVSSEVRPGTAKSMTKKRFREQGETIAKEKAARKKNPSASRPKGTAFKKFYNNPEQED